MYESFTNPQVDVTKDKLLTPFVCCSRNRMYDVNGPNIHVLPFISKVASLFDGF